MEEAKAFAEKGNPLNFIGLETGWQSKSYPCTFEWDKSRFPEPAGFVPHRDWWYPSTGASIHAVYIASKKSQ